MQLWRPKFEWGGINSGSKEILLIVRGNCTAVVCELVYCMDMRPGL